MELKQIKELMAAMGRTGMRRLVIKKETFELTLEREDDGTVRSSDQMLDLGEDNPLRNDIEQHRANLALARGTHPEATGRIGNKGVESDKEDVESSYITAPMVGTFYSSPSPADPTFVKVGDKVDKNTVVCIIEAMKVMNEIKAGSAGTVAELLVETGHPVEFGTKLFRIT